MGRNFVYLFVCLFVCFIQFSFSEFLKSLFRDYAHKSAYSLYVEIWISFAWPLSNVYFQMPRHLACLRGCIIALVAFVGFFSTVCFQMSPQIACIRGCIVTQVAFVCLFSVCFHMCPQMACPRGCIITLVAFHGFGDIVSPLLQILDICIL